MTFILFSLYNFQIPKTNNQTNPNNQNKKLQPADHPSPSSSLNPHMIFMFCTACPAAPLTRLSITLVTTNNRPLLLCAKLILQLLVPVTSFNSGCLPIGKVSTNGSVL